DVLVIRVAIARTPVGEVIGRVELIARGSGMGEIVGVPPPESVDVYAVPLAVLRIASCIDRHAELRHERFETALGGKPVEVIGVREPMRVLKKLGIPVVPIMSPRKIGGHGCFSSRFAQRSDRGLRTAYRAVRRMA